MDQKSKTSKKPSGCTIYLICTIICFFILLAIRTPTILPGMQREGLYLSGIAAEAFGGACVLGLIPYAVISFLINLFKK
jgi:hypothetical protein